MYFFCFNLLTYTAALAVISFYINNENGNNITSFLLNNYNLILSYTMIIVSIWQMMKLVKKLNIDRHNLVKVNNELVEANKLLDESLQYIASLYQAVQNFVNTNSKKKLLCIIAQHVKDITKTPMAFIYLQFENNEEAFETSDAITEDMKIFLLNKFRKDTSFNTYSDDLLTYNYKTKNLIAVNIKSCHEVRGVIGIEVGIRDKGMIEKERVYQIRFLASLSTFIFEKFKIEDMNHKLLIAEEQSRIANEIHDSVSQNLFFISSKLYSISHRYTDGNNTELKNEIDLVNNSLKNAMKELREAIYSYSGKLEEDTPFENNLKKYIDEVSKLNDVNIIVNVTGNQELSDYDVKRIIYRIIYEAVANAIRHGRSKNIFINLQMEKGEVKLDIEDDGTGFDLKSKMLNNSMGLGIKNINNLVYSLNGDIKIDSKPTQGTMIKISFPNLNIVKENRSEAL